MAGTLTIDFTKKIKSSYNLKGKDGVPIVIGGDSPFLSGIKSATASGSTLSVALLLANNKTKIVKFTNVNPDMKIEVLRAVGEEAYSHQVDVLWYYI